MELQSRMSNLVDLSSVGNLKPKWIRVRVEAAIAALMKALRQSSWLTNPSCNKHIARWRDLWLLCMVLFGWNQGEKQSDETLDGFHQVLRCMSWKSPIHYWGDWKKRKLKNERNPISPIPVHMDILGFRNLNLSSYLHLRMKNKAILFDSTQILW